MTVKKVGAKKSKKITCNSSDYSPTELFDVEVTVTWLCPKRGLVTEKVKGKRYSSVKYTPQLDKEEFALAGLVTTEETDDE
jgi:hypothetical protein